MLDYRRIIKTVKRLRKYAFLVKFDSFQNDFDTTIELTTLSTTVPRLSKVFTFDVLYHRQKILLIVRSRRFTSLDLEISSYFRDDHIYRLSNWS